MSAERPSLELVPVRRKRSLLPVVFVVLLLAPACTVHRAIDAGQRLVPLEQGASHSVPDEVPDGAAPPCSEWRPAEAGDIEGLYVSQEIRGAAAACVRRMECHFDRSGRYSAAALIVGPNGPRHEVVHHTWALDGDRVRLGDGSPAARASVAGRWLRLETDEGTVLLKR